MNRAHCNDRNVDFYPGSVLVWQDQLNLFQGTVDKYGRIDIVLANAGVDEVLEDVFVDSYDDAGQLKAPTLIVLDINLRGAIYTSKLALSFFRKLGVQGSLVLTGSAASYLDTPGIPVYNASKHGMLGLVRSLRDTLTQEGLVRANVVAPWFTQTPFTAHVLHLWQGNNLPINQPIDIAWAILFLALNTTYHGKTIYVAGGKYTELEGALEASRGTWLGKENAAAIDKRREAKLKLGKQDS